MPKIVYIASGQFPLQKFSGIVWLYQLIEELSNLGWEITYLCGGRYDLKRKPYLYWHRKKNSFKLVELVNSPNLNMPYSFWLNPLSYCQNDVIDRLFEDVLKEEKPDIVHIHSFRTFSASLIDKAKEKNVVVIRTPHDLLDVCPQGNLMYQGETYCHDFQEGQRCVECLSSFPRETFSFFDRLRGSFLPTPIYPLIKVARIGKLLPKLYRPKKRTISLSLPFPYKASDYVYRRNFFVERLNKINIVHCLSTRSSEIFMKYGVKKEKVRVINITSGVLPFINPKPFRDNRCPIVFGYVGGLTAHKGIHVLLEVFSRLDQKKSKLLLYGGGELSLLNGYKNLNVEYKGYFPIEKINVSFSKIDVGIMPSIWEDTFPLAGLEFLAAKIPVIGSRIGGIPDWLKDGENGFLVTPGDVNDLYQKMNLFVEKPTLIQEMQKKIKPWKTVKENALEFDVLYRGLLQVKQSKR